MCFPSDFSRILTLEPYVAHVVCYMFIHTGTDWDAWPLNDNNTEVQNSTPTDTPTLGWPSANAVTSGWPFTSQPSTPQDKKRPQIKVQLKWYNDLYLPLVLLSHSHTKSFFFHHRKLSVSTFCILYISDIKFVLHNHYAFLRLVVLKTSGHSFYQDQVGSLCLCRDKLRI